jgi:hypothetical protein
VPTGDPELPLLPIVVPAAPPVPLLITGAGLQPMKSRTEIGSHCSKRAMAMASDA